MFEGTNVGRKVSAAHFKEQIPALRTELLAAQLAVRQKKIPVIVVISGVDAAGKGEVVNVLKEWLDPRGVNTHAYWDETVEEKEKPRYWKFWRSLPSRGEIAILFGAWYMAPVYNRLTDHCNDAELDAELTRITDFERMLTEDDALIVKFWFHLSADEQKSRLKQLKRDDRSRWRMAPKMSKFDAHYEKFESVAERIIRQTDSGIAPWFLIEATDRRYRDLTVGRTLLEAIRDRLETPVSKARAPSSHAPSLPMAPEAQVTVLDHVELENSLSKGEYKKKLSELQSELNELAWTAYNQKRSCVMVFEGVDAGGKGGAIRRITSAIDSRLYQTIPIAAPTDEEKAHHYLWRFWRHIPRAGRLTIYDRSWYGRVLVERVEGFATEDEWRRAYLEINDFEEQLVQSGVILLKFWLHISQDEQLRRFKAREEVPYKQHKITEEDWRNREKWSEYKSAVNEMVIRTSTELAPWEIIPGNDKRFARIAVLQKVCDRLRSGLKNSSFGKSGYSPCIK